MNIHTAAKVGDLSDVRNAIKRGDDVNSVDKYGWTPLRWAANRGHTDCVRELLSYGAIVDLADKDGWTPLRWAVSEARTDCVRELLSYGALVDLANKDGCTPLRWAAYLGHTDCVRELLSYGAVVDLANEVGHTRALWWAASEGHTDCVRELFSYGAVVDLADKDGHTPLMMAACYGYEDTVKELLSLGASVNIINRDGETALMVANKSDRSNQPTIKLLEEAESHPRLQSVQVLPKNWTAVTDAETEKPVYRNNATGETLFTPPGYPLHQTSAHPDVTFYGEPQKKVFTPSGGHADFDNGVEVTVPANAVSAGTSVSIKVQPSLASRDVLLMPEGIQSASPSYLISGEGLNGEVTLSMEHHVRVSTQEEADDLLFLQADSYPKRSGSKSVYEYQRVQEGRSEFTLGGNTGRLTRCLSKKQFFKVGHQARVGGLDAASQSDDPTEPESPNLYTVRVYQSPPQTVGDRIAIIAVCLFGSFYAKFLEKLDKVVIPRDYPEVSSKSIYRTIQGSLKFVDMCATLSIHPVQGWSVEPDKELISRSEVDQPEMEKFRADYLHDYPPRIICRFFPEENAPKRTTCTISLSGLLPQVKVHLLLKAPTPTITVDTTKLQEATDELRRSALAVSDTQLGFTVHSVHLVSLMERMTTSLRSSSLSELAAHTDSIQTEIASVLVVTKRVVEECTVQSISENIEAGLSKMEALSHQLCLVTKVKLRHCQDQLEETAALVDLVENGANLLRAVDCLLRDIRTLSGVSGNSGYSVLVSCSDKIVQSLSQEPKAVAVYLLSVGLITERVLQETNQLNEINADKATRLYTALLGVVKHHPHKYHEFVSTLRLNPLHTDLVRELDSKYMYSLSTT